MSDFTGDSANGASRVFHDQHRVHYDRQSSVHDVFRQQAQANPDALAVSFGERSLTYQELDRLSDALAVHLIRRGICKGDAVGLALPRSLEVIVAKLAILKAAAAYVPLDPAFPLGHLRYVVQECRPKVVFTNGMYFEHVRVLSESNCVVIDLEALLPKLTWDPIAALPRVGGGDVAYVMYTSGSTGRPKGVAIPHRGIARLVLDQNFITIARSDAVLHAATISFDATTFEVWSALLNGAALIGVVAPTYTVADLCQVIRKNNVTVMLLTSGMFNLFADFAAVPLPTLRQILFGGEAGSVEHVKRFHKAYPNCLMTNIYGPTECSCIATTYTVPSKFDRLELPIGKAIAQTDVLILDEHLHPVPPGVEGQIALAGDGLAVGYVQRPDLNDHAFVEVVMDDRSTRCYLTGDLAVEDHDGTILFKGRRDRQVKINGKRIELDEVEAAVRRDPHVLDGVVACHSQGSSIKRIIAYLRPRDLSSVDEPDFVRGFMTRLRDVLPAYMIPSVAIVLPELPLTPAGKVDRAKLPAPPPIEGTGLAVPESSCEALLVRLWRSALGLEDIPLDRNFFDLGGTSLQLLRVHASLTAELAREVDVFVLFKHPTIRELAGFLEGTTVNAAPSLTADQRAALQRKSLSQFRRSAS